MTSPKIHILPSDVNQNVDPTLTKTLLNFLPNRVANINDADVVITVVSWMGGYQFNPALYEVKKKLILLDYLEMGWQAGEKDNVLGRGALKQFGHLDIESYAKLDQWAKDCQPALTFKRELFQRDISATMIPTSWLCYLPSKPLQEKERYDARPFEIFYNWGLSSPSRPRLHGKIFIGSQEHNYHVIDGWNQDQRLEKRNWVALHTPHYARQGIQEVMRWQRRAKISVSLFGAGRRSFRDSEAPVDCVMARPMDSTAWPFPWTAENSIQLRQEYEFEDLLAATQRTDLYELYRAAQENIDKYRSQRFVDEYLMPILTRVV